jgi:hypothetical protein
MMLDYDKIKKEVYEFQTKHTSGYNQSEITKLLEKLNINEKRFKRYLGVYTCMIIDWQVITYHKDILNGIICAVVDREKNIIDWD